MKAALSVCLGALLFACSAPSVERVVDGPVRTNAAPRGDTLLRDAMMAVHNRARAAVGTPPLEWDTTLAAHADAYAGELAATGRMQHAVQPQGPGREGENLFTGTHNAYRFEEMAQLWVDERQFFVNRPTPNFSTTLRWEDVGHYTQIVWRSTTRVGCGMASNARDDFLVCRYSPPGNVVGQRAF